MATYNIDNIHKTEYIKHIKNQTKFKITIEDCLHFFVLNQLQLPPKD